MTRIAIVYHSGYGHTAKVAEAVAEGVRSVPGCEVHVCATDTLTDADWHMLDQADGIIFGAPTYMGGVSGQFKLFIDAASKRWFKQVWKDKIAAGFTNSGTYDGDKLGALLQLSLFAMQHSMIWVGSGIMPANARGTDLPDGTQINRFGSFLGLMTQSNNESPEITPPAGDLTTARLFGERVAQVTMRFGKSD